MILTSDEPIINENILSSDQTRIQTLTRPADSTIKELAKAKEETLQTPTAAENKIPPARSPPPAPKKRRRVGLKCVRKLEFMGQQQQQQQQRPTIIPDEQATSKLFNSDYDHQQHNSVKICKRSTSLAFDRINSNNVAISTQIV